MGHPPQNASDIASSAISEYKWLSDGIGYRVLRCNEGWLAAVLGFLLQDFGIVFAVQCRFTSLLQLWRFCFFRVLGGLAHHNVKCKNTVGAPRCALRETRFLHLVLRALLFARPLGTWSALLVSLAPSPLLLLSLVTMLSRPLFPVIGIVVCSPPFLASWVLLASLPLLSSSLVTLELSRVCALEHLGFGAFNVFSTIWNWGNSNVFSVSCTSDLSTIFSTVCYCGNSFVFSMKCPCGNCNSMHISTS